MHGVWAQLPVAAKEYIGQREYEMICKLSEFGRLNNEASQAAERLGINELANVLEHHAHSIPRLPDGQPMPPHAVLQRLLQANEMLLRDPEKAIKWLAQDRGVDVARLAEAPVDPIERARQQERQAIFAQLQQHQQRQAAAYEQQVTDFIEAFAKEKPNWHAIEDEVHYHVLALKGTNPDMSPHEVLQRAYDRALASRPEMDPRAKESSQRELAERKRKADEARKFASLNVGMRSAGGLMSSVDKSMEQTMREVADRMMG
ncbi:MAG: hypothetical protein ACM3IH_02425 [Sphingobacteriales bacterium]|jgi:hypothetical protein